jgi:AraC family transcriptional regulator
MRERAMSVDELFASDGTLRKARGPATAYASAGARWHDLALVVERESIRTPTRWSDDRWNVDGGDHVIIVHLDGTIRRIETEVDGIGAQVPPLGAGDVSVIPAGHRYVAEARGGVVTYATARIPARTANTDQRPAGDVALTLGHRDPFVYETVRRLVSLMRRGDDLAGMLGQELSHALTLHLYDAYPVGAVGARRRASGPVLSAQVAETLRQYVQDNLSRSITLGALATIADVSVDDLLIAFRRAFGTTPAQYVIDQRLQRAQSLLTDTAQGISTIALATGFATHSHLTTTFRRRLGMTPREYRGR